MFRLNINTLKISPFGLGLTSLLPLAVRGRISFLLVISFLALSCSNKKEDVVNFDDISTSSDRYKEGQVKKDSTSNLPKTYDLLSNISKTWVDSLGFEKEKIFLLDTTLFNDRFGAKKTEKWVYKTEKDSLVFMHWEFRDSIKTQNTFYNWLDCFGPSCKSIMIGQEVKFSKRGLVFLLQNNHLFSIESSLKQDIERYISLFDNIKWNKTWKYIMVQMPRKKANWFSRNSEGVFVPIKVF